MCVIIDKIYKSVGAYATHRVSRWGRLCGVEIVLSVRNDIAQKTRVDR